MNTPSVGEVLAKVQSAQTKEEKLSVLKKNDSNALRAILRLAFDLAIKFDLPKGRPNFRPNTNPVGMGDCHLLVEYRAFYVFVKPSSPGLTDQRRLARFIQLLEALDIQEAGYLCAAKDKELELGLSGVEINEAFSGLLVEPSDKISVEVKTRTLKAEYTIDVPVENRPKLTVEESITVEVAPEPQKVEKKKVKKAKKTQEPKGGVEASN